MDNDDPLLKKARQAEARAQRHDAERGLVKSDRGIADYFSLIVNIVVAIKRFWLFGMVGNILAWFFKKIVIGVKWASFERDQGEYIRDENGGLIFSAKRLGKTLLGVFFVLFFLHIAISAAYFYGTQFEETVYTTGKQEITTGELYQFTGCTSLPCSTDAGNGKFYQIGGSWYFPYLVYPEEEVYANIPQQDGACEVRGYGFYIRELKALHRRLQWYQNVYNISCRPYSEKEKAQAVRSGDISIPPENKP